MPIFLKGQFALFQNIKKLSEAGQAEVARAIQETAQKIALRARSNAPVDSGGLSGAIKEQILGRGMTAQIRALPSYALPVEMGYKGRSGRGNRRNRFPAIKRGGKWRVVPALEAYALRRGIPPWALAVKIHRKGYAAQPFLFPAMEAERQAFLDRVKQAIADDAPKAVSG